MSFPRRACRMPSRRVPPRRHRGAVLTATLAALATGGALALVAAAPAGAVARDRTTTATRTATTTATATTTTGSRVQPRWVSPVRSRTRVGTIDPAAAEVVRLVNLARAAAGCGALRVDGRLTTAARLHSEDMARRDYFSHTSLDGRSPWDRIEAQGYQAGSGENIAAGYSTPAAVMDAWMKSTGHRANILSCSSRAIGVGLGHGGSYGTYWTQDFGRE